MRLHGEKLNGEFALVRTNGMGENSWLLVKHDDNFATKKDILKLDKSILSYQTIAQMEKTSKDAPGNNKDKENSKKALNQKKLKVKREEGSVSKKIGEKEIEHKQWDKILNSAPKGSIPRGIKPMLATLVDAPFDDSEWQYEVKWDGYRTLAFVEDGKADLFSRNNKSFNDKFYTIQKILFQWKLNAVFDGEIVVLNEKGISNFSALQNWRGEADGELVCYVFDLLWYEGKTFLVLV